MDRERERGVREMQTIRVNAEPLSLRPTPWIFRNQTTTIPREEIRHPFDVFKITEKRKTASDSDSDDKKFEVFEIPHKKRVLVHLKHPCKLYFHGKLKVVLVTGSVEILGLTCGGDKKWACLDVFSSNFGPALCFETNGIPDESYKNKFQFSCTQTDNVLRNDVAKEILAQLRPLDAILIVEDLISDLPDLLSAHIQKPCFPKRPTSGTLSKQFWLTPNPLSKEYVKNPEWAGLSLQAGRITVLCGGKGVGKSTLLRYLANKSLEHVDKVLCLDLDPGQPEFTPPGCIAAVVVEVPLLGPNFCHVQRNPQRMFYLGEVNVSQCPSYYLEIVRELSNYCSGVEDLKKLPWVVNTMGFSKGLGVALMMNVLDMLKPDVLVQISSNNPANNYPFELTPAQVYSSSNIAFRPIRNPVLLNFQYISVSSVAEKSGSQRTAREQRDMMLLAYLSPLMTAPNYNLNGCQPFSIPFCKLFLSVSSAIKPVDLLKAFNGSLVAMSYFEEADGSVLKPSSPEYYKVVQRHFRPLPCYGLGFVRGVDCIKKRLYLITHLTEAQLERVNCLSLGSISPPGSLYLKQACDGVSVVPYTTLVSQGANTQQIRRPFKSLQHPQPPQY